MGRFMVFSLYNIIIKVRATPLSWFYALKLCSTHVLNISDLRKSLQKSIKKALRVFGGYVKKLYLCTRNRERDAAVIEILKVKLGSSNLL